MTDAALFGMAPVVTGPDHAHTGTGCIFCATRTGQEAATAGAVSVVNADPEWRYRADAYLSRIPVGDTFTADDLIAAVGKPAGSPNQIGATLRAWKADHWIAPAGYAPATRPESHGRVIAVWEVI